VARKKDDSTVSRTMHDSSQFEEAPINFAEKLGQAFEHVITTTYGFARAPKPYITPTGIQHLDALLGGGIVSSSPIVLSSTPETGKSTFAFQFAKTFQTLYQNSIIVYLDVEGAANASGSTKVDGSFNNSSRIQILAIDEKRFRYEPIIIDIYGFFDMIVSLVDIKKAFEEKLQKEFKIMIVWDSIAATPCSKLSEVTDPNKIIGLKARQLSFCIEKYAPLLAYNRITFLTIDQVRANLQLEGQYVAKEKSVGTWNDYKAASSIIAFNHRVGQWLFLSRKAAINPSDGMGITGWFMNITTEKNKIAPSQESVTCVFDKRTGLHKFWSEYIFVSEMTRSELKYFKEEKNLIYPLAIRKTGPQVYLEFIDPVTKNVQYTSDKFYRKNAFDKYQSDEAFKNAFDYIVSTSVEQRITNGLFQLKTTGVLENIVSSDELVDNIVEPQESQESEIQEEVVKPEEVKEVVYESAFDEAGD